jgi:hydroxypyruvate reductase
VDPRYSDHHQHFNQLLNTVMEAANPERIVREALYFEPEVLSVHNQRIDLAPKGKIILIAAGKAASPMVRAVKLAILRDFDCVIVSRPDSDHSLLPDRWQVFQAGHPLPNEASLAAGEAVKNALQNLRFEDLVILLLSGGGSALLELAKKHITIEDLRAVNTDLLRSGAPIEEINIVRKSMSQIKAGGLARLAAPARVLSLILSDVVGDDLGVIASGPTSLENVDTSHAVAILEHYDLWNRYPHHFQKALLEPHKDRTETRPPINILLANNYTVQRAAAEKATRLGFMVKVLEKPLYGEARIAGAVFARELSEFAGKPPGENAALIQGGETTVTVKGDGRGGRNQEFVVAAAQEIDHQDHLAIMSFATDGVDGPTDAAGAIVNSGFIRLAQSKGFEIQDHLEQNNVYPLLDRMGALVRTGPTRTNLNDVAVGFKYLNA